MQIFVFATITFLIASRYLNRHPEHREIAKDMKGGVPVQAISGNNVAFIFLPGHVSLSSLQTTA